MRSEPLMAGQDEAVALGQMSKDQRVCSEEDWWQARTRGSAGELSSECCRVKLRKVPSHSKRQDSSRTE